MKKVSERKKFKMKKSVRLTIAAALAVTALIVAAIPVTVTEAVSDPGELISLNDIVFNKSTDDPPVYTYKTSTLNGVTLSVQGTGTAYYGFPMIGNDYVRITDTDNNNHDYYQINTENMDTKNDPVAIFELKSALSNSTPGCITRYVGDGGSGHTPSSGAINLGERVCYQSTPIASDYSDTFYQYDAESSKYYEIVERAKETNNTLVPAASPTILEVSKQEIQFYKNVPVLDELGNPKLDSDNNPILEKNYETATLTNNDGFDYVGQAQYFFACDKTQVIYSIGDDAFKDTANFDKIIIPPGLTAIGNSAFYNAKNLNSIDIGLNCLSLGNLAFGNCIRLENVSFAENCPLGVIGDGAFAYSKIKSMVLPNVVTDLGSAVFYGCSELNDSVEGISGTYSGMFSKAAATDMRLGNYVFAGSGITDIHLYDNIKTLGEGTFEMCTNLQHAEMPSNYSSTLPAGTFEDCPNLQWVRFKNNLTGEPSPKEFTTPSLVTIHGKDANVKEDFAIWGPNPNENTSDIHKYAIDNSNTYMYDKDGTMYYELTLNYYKFIFNQNGEIDEIIPQEGHGEELIIPSQIGNVVPVTINPGAYKGDATGNPKKLIINQNIKSIGDDAFSKCGTIEEVDITTEGVDIGKNAFSDNANLKKVLFAQVEGTTGETKIGERAFYNCPKLEDIHLLDDTFDKTSGTYDYVHISEMGNEALKTYGDKLTITGPMQTGYAPYDFAVAGNSINSTTVGYITYRTGNPQNLECKYDQYLGGASLTSYPNVTTKVGKEIDPNTGNEVDVTVHDLMLRRDNGYQPFYNMQQWICDYADYIVVPDGIEYIDNASSSIYTDDTHVDPSLRVHECTLFSDLYDPWYETDLINNNQDNCNGIAHGAHTITLDSVSKIPDDCFKNNLNTSSVTFNGDIDDFGDLPFYVGDVTPGKALNSQLHNVYFNGDAPTSGTPENPKYWCENGLIFADDGSKTVIVECLPARGNGDGLNKVTADETSAVNEIDPRAFENCDHIESVDLSAAKDLTTLSSRSFYDCDNLADVYLPDAKISISKESFASNDISNPKNVPLEIMMPSSEYDIADDAFKNVKRVTLYSLPDSAAQRYAKRIDNVDFQELTVYPVKVTLNYRDATGNRVRETFKIDSGSYAPGPTKEYDTWKDHQFEYWDGYTDGIPEQKVSYRDDKILEDTTFDAIYKDVSQTTSSSSSTSSSTSGSTSKPSGSTSGGSSSSSSKVSTSITSTTVQPVIVSGTGTVMGAGGVLPTVGGATSGSGSGSGSGKNYATDNVGKTKLISTTGGITDTSKMSATVNGSSDNYVIKISETEEANQMAAQALTGAFGSLDPIRYLPFDISLYDTTGTNKISPIPAGVSINITMPIPDNLAIYGGNNKVACTEGGTLDKIQPKFTVINGVPCMNYTVTHLSPYVVYVDTNNLTATGTLDSTPKTGDPIHPKWFLVIGLAAISGVLFLKRDKKEAVA